MSIQMRLNETYCCTCKYYTIGEFGVIIMSENGSEYVPHETKGCTLHNTSVLPLSRACDDYDGGLKV